MIEKGIRSFMRLAERSLQRTMATSYPLDVTSEDTGLHKLTFIPPNPFTLFQNWFADHQTENHILSNSLSLSTATRTGKVSSRNVILRRLDEDGFVIMTDSRSKKSKELEENPNAAIAFLWVKDNEGLIHSRQVRAEGLVKQLPYEDWKDIYSKEPLFCKIRSYVCHQGQKVEWEKLKEHHDSLLEQFRNGKHDLSRPDHVVAYKIMPDMMEFYESKGPRIADRVMYLMENNCWQSARIAA